MKGIILAAAAQEAQVIFAGNGVGLGKKSEEFLIEAPDLTPPLSFNP
ncbi:hypothetical protein [Rhizobium binxianense]